MTTENTPPPPSQPPAPAPYAPHTAPAPAEPQTFTREYVSEMRHENERWRNTAHEARAAKEAAERVAAEAKTHAEQAAAKAKAEAEASIAEARARAEARIIHAEMKAAAVKAGMVDLDGLKLLDTSEVKLDEKGDVVIPDKFFEEAKKARPWLFGSTTASTSNPSQTPKPAPPRDYRTAPDEEVDAALRMHGVRVGRR